MAFKLYDKDKDGYITRAEMVKLSKNLSKEQVEKVQLLMCLKFTGVTYFRHLQNLILTEMES